MASGTTIVLANAELDIATSGKVFLQNQDFDIEKKGTVKFLQGEIKAYGTSDIRNYGTFSVLGARRHVINTEVGNQQAIFKQWGRLLVDVGATSFDIFTKVQGILGSSFDIVTGTLYFGEDTSLRGATINLNADVPRVGADAPSIIEFGTHNESSGVTHRAIALPSPYESPSMPSRMPSRISSFQPACNRFFSIPAFSVLS